MAISPTVIFAGGDDTNRTGSSTAYSTPSVALAAGRLYLLFITTHRSDSGANGPLSAVQAGATWQTCAEIGVGSDYRSTVFRTQPVSNISSAVIYVGNFSAVPIDFVSWVLVEIDGAYDDAAFNGSFAVPAQANVQGNASSISLSVSDVSAPNATFGFFYHTNTGSFTPVTGTELTDTTLGARAIAAYWNLGGDSVAVTAANSATYHGLAVKVRAAETASAVDVNLVPTADTYLNRQNTTANYDSSTVLLIGGQGFNGNSLFSRRALLDFDLSSLDTGPGVYIREAILYMTVSDATSAGANNGEHPHLGAVRILRDVVMNQTTWNIYKTGNNWNVACGMEVNTDRTSHVCSGDDMQSNSVGTIYRVDIAELLNQARTCGDPRLVAMVGPTAFTASQNYIGFASLEHATSAYRPYLEVTYGYTGDWHFNVHWSA